MERKRTRLEPVPGTPCRVRRRDQRPRRGRGDLDLDDVPEVVPCRVRVDVEGGRNLTGTARRVGQVQRALTAVGAPGHAVDLTPGSACVETEMNRQVAEHVVGLRFVRGVRRA